MRSLLAVALVLIASARVHAEEDVAKADQLFEEAQQLKQAGNTTEACAKYEEALSYNKNAVGTLLNVAKCAEDSGRVATAVKHYTQARDLAREHNLTEHRTAAEQRLEVTAPRVPRLAIAFTERLPDMKLVIDDIVYPTDEASTSELRLDPGARHIVVTAPGRLPFDTTVTLVEGKQGAVAIPKLGYPVTVKKARRTVGKILTFSGAGLILVGIGLGYEANRDYENEFDDGRCMKNMMGMLLCDAEGHAATKSARQLGTTGTVVGIAGGAALVLGAVLWFTAPTEHGERNVAIVPSVTPETAGVAAVGRF